MRRSIAVFSPACSSVHAARSVSCGGVARALPRTGAARDVRLASSLWRGSVAASRTLHTSLPSRGDHGGLSQVRETFLFFIFGYCGKIEIIYFYFFITVIAIYFIDELLFVVLRQGHSRSKWWWLVGRGCVECSTGTRRTITSTRRSTSRRRTTRR